MKRVSVYVDQMRLFVIINKAGIMINVDANVNNWLIKVFAIKDMLGILIVNANVINDVMLVKYLDYENCKCRKKIVDKLVDKCTETVEEVKLAENENNYKCSSCTVYTVLFWTFFTINIGGIGAYFVYFQGYLKKDVNRVRFDTRTQTYIY